MKQVRSALVLVFVLCLFWVGETFATKRLPPTTLQEAIAEALKNHPGIARSQAVAEAAHARVGVERAKFYPWLDASASATKGLSGSYGRLDINGMGASPFKSLFGGSVNLWWTLLDFGRTSSAVDSAKAYASAANIRTEVVRWLIRFEVEQTFHQCVFLSEQHAASFALQREREARAERIKKLTESGVRSQVDAAMAQADLARAKGQREAHFAAVITCRYQLGVLMGRGEGSQMPSPTMDSSPSGGTSADDNAETSIPDVAEVMKRARARRPDRKALVLQKTALEEELSQVHSMHLPELRASASGGMVFQRDANDDLVDSGKYYAVGVAIEIPLFEGFRVQHLADEAAARVRAQEARIRALDLRIRGEVQSARVQLMAGMARVEFAKQAVPAAKQALELARQEYDAGLVDALYLSTAETILWQARVEQAEASAVLNKALSAFEHAQGGP